MASNEGAFSKLPVELFLLVLDALVDCSLPPQQPVAYPPSHPTTKALLALTRVSRAIYPLASRYLYASCCYLNATNFKRIHRTLGSHFDAYSQTAQNTRPDYKEALWKEADVLRYMNRAYFSTRGKSPKGKYYKRPPDDILDLLLTIGTQLKTLVLNIPTLHVERHCAEAPQLTANTSLGSSNNWPICLSMPLLEELVVSFNITRLMPTPPPYLQRLCITGLKREDVLFDFHHLIPSLKVVMVPGFMGFQAYTHQLLEP